MPLARTLLAFEPVRTGRAAIASEQFVGALYGADEAGGRALLGVKQVLWADAIRSAALLETAADLGRYAAKEKMRPETLHVGRPVIEELDADRVRISEAQEAQDEHARPSPHAVLDQVEVSLEIRHGTEEHLPFEAEDSELAALGIAVLALS